MSECSQAEAEQLLKGADEALNQLRCMESGISWKQGEIEKLYHNVIQKCLDRHVYKQAERLSKDLLLRIETWKSKKLKVEKENRPSQSGLSYQIAKL